MADRAGFVMVHYAELDKLRGDPRALEVWCALLRFADFETQQAYPALETLAKSIKASEDTVRRAIDRLQELGLLRNERRTNSRGRQFSNLYTLLRVPFQEMGSTAATPAIKEGSTAATPGVASVQGMGSTDATQTRTIEQEPSEHRGEDEEEVISCKGNGTKIFDLSKRLRAKPFECIYAEDAIRQAMEKGVTIKEIEAIADFWLEKGLWTSAQLKTRIEQACPGEPPNERWMPADKTGKAPKSKRKVRSAP